MSLMNIGIFAYNFNHKKTHNGLLELFLNGYHPKCILAANPVKLTFYHFRGYNITQQKTEQK